MKIIFLYLRGNGEKKNPLWNSQLKISMVLLSKAVFWLQGSLGAWKKREISLQRKRRAGLLQRIRAMAEHKTRLLGVGVCTVCMCVHICLCICNKRQRDTNCLN